MNRWLIAMVTGLLVTGCAAGVEDPQPAPPPDPVQKDPPAQTFSGELDDSNPYDSIASGLDDGIPNVPPRQKPPVPGLVPVPAEE